MTIKEALERIIKSHSIAMACLGIEDKETEQAINIIEKDLEVLKILKDHLVTADRYIMICIHKDNKDFNKVKEWLENDK